MVGTAIGMLANGVMGLGGASGRTGSAAGAAAGVGAAAGATGAAAGGACTVWETGPTDG